MRVVRMVLVLVVAVLIACPLMAQEKQKKKGHHGPHAVADPFERVLQGLNLTDEQKAKFADVKKEFAPKWTECRSAMEAVLTPEQKKARAAAFKEARSEGKSPKEIAKAVQEALNLTPEQKTKRAEVGKKLHALQKEELEKIEAFLTPDQKEQLKKKFQHHHQGGKKKHQQ